MAIPPGSLQRLYDFSDPACYNGSGFVNNLAQIAYRFLTVNATFAGSGTSKYFEFNGTNQSISTMESGGTQRSIGGPYSALTINVWFQAASTARGSLVSWGRTSTSAPSIITNDANFVSAPGRSTGSFNPNVGNVETSNVVDVDLWQMITYTADGTQTRIYRNGVLEDTDTQDGGQWPNYGSSIIGAKSGAYGVLEGPYFNGKIAYIAQYNAAISGPDILDLYNTLSPRFPNPVIITTPSRSYAQGFNG